MGAKWMILSFAVGVAAGAAYGFWRGWCVCTDMRDLCEGSAMHAGGRGERMGISRMENSYKQWATENRIRRTGMGIGTVDNEALAELESVARDVKAAMNLRDLAAAHMRYTALSVRTKKEKLTDAADHFLNDALYDLFRAIDRRRRKLVRKGK